MKKAAAKKKAGNYKKVVAELDKHVSIHDAYDTDASGCISEVEGIYNTSSGIGLMVMLKDGSWTSNQGIDGCDAGYSVYVDYAVQGLVEFGRITGADAEAFFRRHDQKRLQATRSSRLVGLKQNARDMGYELVKKKGLTKGQRKKS